MFDVGSPLNPEGCDGEGNCVVEDDPCPSDTCNTFECNYCGGDGCPECTEVDWEDED